MTTQIWKIGGKSYNKEQLLAMRAAKSAPKAVDAPLVNEEVVDVTTLKFLELKSYAKSKGMDVKTNTKKAEILDYLQTI